MIKAWKALLSGAVVTEGEALGKRILYGCLEDSTSYGVNVGMHKYQGTAFQAVIPATLVPRASPSVTNASLSTAFQADHRHTTLASTACLVMTYRLDVGYTILASAACLVSPRI